jgi:acetyltransferase
MSYTIAKYPVRHIDVVRSADGTRVTLRPILPQDAELQRVFFGSLSAQSRYSRFMCRLDELPAALAERFTCIDYRNHFALVATVFEAGGLEIMIGEARYIAEDGDPATCELAIAVADAWQGTGIARALLDRLERAAAASGFQRMVADSLTSNGTMLGLAQRAGYVVTANPHDRALARLEKRLQPPAAIAA